MQDPEEQLRLATIAVFESWNSPRAIKYRSINQISGLKGTAVNIQTMVFGNMGATSGTGVLFTRNPSTGEKKLYGEFLINAQVDLISIYNRKSVRFWIIFFNFCVVIF
jgi:pyruvate,orthophosphate dikinase